MYEYASAGGFGNPGARRRFREFDDDLFGETEDAYADKMAALVQKGEVTPEEARAAIAAPSGYKPGMAPPPGVGEVIGAILNPIGAISGALGGGGGGGPGGILSNLPIIGGLLGGGGGGGGLLPGLPGLPNIGGLLGGLGQGVTQALGQAPASSPLGSILGAGLGGLTSGTGPLPDPLGLFAQRNFGTNALPPAAVVDSQSMLSGPWRDLATHTERIGRAIVTRVMGMTGPQLQEVQDWIRQRGAQLQATGEHRNIMADTDFRAAVIQHLLGISNYLGLPGQFSPALGISSAATPAASIAAAQAVAARKRY